MFVIDKRIIGDKIYQIRKEKGLTQAKFGEVFGVEPQAVSYWELGKGLPQPSTFKQIAEFGDKTVAWLLTK